MKNLGRLLTSVLEYGLGFVFVYASYVSFTAPTLAGSAFATFLGGEVALAIYATWFLILGVMLVLANIFQWTKMRKHTLMAMYTTVVFIIILKLYFAAYGVSVISDAIVGIWAAALWLKLKLSCDYIRIRDL